MIESLPKTAVPFFRPVLTDDEIREVVETLLSGWLTTGAKTRAFEAAFAQNVHATYAVALNSCTAALHLAVEALGLGPGQAVLVPTMTFAATAEVVRYQGAVPVLVDCDPLTGNMRLEDAQDKIVRLQEGRLVFNHSEALEVVGIMPVHVGGLMMNVAEVKSFAAIHKLWIVELPLLPNRTTLWQPVGLKPFTITIPSFLATTLVTHKA